MPKFIDSLAELLSGDGVVVPEGFSDTLTGAYNDDVAEMSGDLNTTIALRDEEIRKMKAESAINTIDASDKEPFVEPGGDDDEYDDISTDDFFSDDPDDDGRWDK